MPNFFEWNSRDAFAHRVYPVTRRIAIGQFATPQRAQYLRKIGVTHILNVGEAASVVSAKTEGFSEVVDEPLVDMNRIPSEVAIRCLDRLHQTLGTKDSLVYVHCIACQNRSPTVVWLHLIACGIDTGLAKERITGHCPDAVPGHSLLVDEELVETVVQHGRDHYWPLTDSNIVDFV